MVQALKLFPLDNKSWQIVMDVLNLSQCYGRVTKKHKFDFCLTVHHQLGKVMQMNQLDATMIY